MGRRLAVLMAGAVWLCGCGGPMTPDELARSIGTLESTAAEGALLAEQVAEDRSMTTFVRAHARELGEVADHEAEKLNDAEANPEGGVAATKTKAVDLADRISAALGHLQIAPDSETEGRTAADALNRLSERAGKLADQL